MLQMDRYIQGYVKHGNRDPYFESYCGVDSKNYSGGAIERCVRSIMASAHCFSIHSKTFSIVTWAFKIKGVSKENL